MPGESKVDPDIFFPGTAPSPNGNGHKPKTGSLIKGADDRFTDARLAETVAAEVLKNRFIWASGLGWLEWDGRRWCRSTDVSVIEALRQYVLDRFNAAVAALKKDQGPMADVDGWRGLLAAGRLRAVRDLARGIVEHRVDELDGNPDLLNTPDGVIELRTGEVRKHDPSLLQTKITSGSYKPGIGLPDWAKALEALHEPERVWLQARIGQAITGHTTPDGIMPICQGSGENGKSLVLTDGLVPALGDYASMASPKLFQGSKSEHSTERAELRGQRLLIAEELTEGRSIDITALKQVQDVGRITARFIRQDNFTFTTSHSLFCTTNYVPVINETDHGTWRRLALLKFPFTFRKASEPLDAANDRRADQTLKARIKANDQRQHDAIVTWAVQGAIRWYQEGPGVLAVTERIAADTLGWRSEADRVLGYWHECLTPDRDACVITTELRDHFNEWLTTNGHNAWSKELFGPRFLAHNETVKHGVEETQARSTKGLRRRPGAWGEPPGKFRVYRGVRYTDPSDQQEQEDGTSGTTSEKKHTESADLGDVPRGRSGRSTASEGHEDPVNRWREERCNIGVVVSANADLYEDFTAWLVETGGQEMTSQKFLARLRKLGHVAVEKRSGYRVGLCLKPRTDPPDADVHAAVTTLRLGGLLERRSRSDGDGGIAWRKKLKQSLKPAPAFRASDWTWLQRPAPPDFSPPEPEVVGQCRTCGGEVVETSRWRDEHPACRTWPSTGSEYGKKGD